jgi:SPP1 gp7 family putative phage head morphogenesis protein
MEASLNSAAEYVLGREVAAAAAALAAGGPQGALRALAVAAREVWPQRWRDALSGPLSVVMQSATEGAAPVFGSFTLANPAMLEYLDGYTSELAGTLSETSYANFERVLVGGMDEGLSVPQVAAQLDELPEVNRSRAELISRTELVRASNGASLEQARRSGVVRGKRWLATNDARTRPEHRALSGVVVPVDQPFPNGEMHPGSPNCRCTVTFELDMDVVRGRVA